MENQEANAAPQSASLSTDNDDKLSMTPMSEQHNVGGRGLDDHAAQGWGKVGDVAKGLERNSATSVYSVASQEPESSDGKQLVAKRKRGRPKKSEEVNGHVVLSSSSVETGLQTNSSANSVKRSRGRPPGTGRLQLLASCGGIVAESAGGSFTTHVICVNPGDNVVNIIKYFSWGPRAVVILSATGSLSAVSVRTAGGVLQFKGNFEVMNLNGSFVNGASGCNNKVGSMSIIFANPDGNLRGGQVEGMMIAATPFTIIAGSFKQNICNEIRRKYPAESSSALKVHEWFNESHPPAKVREGEENSIAPRSPLLSGALGGVVISETQHLEPSSLQTVGPEDAMPLQPVLEQNTPPEHIVENGEESKNDAQVAVDVNEAEDEYTSDHCN